MKIDIKSYFAIHKYKGGVILKNINTKTLVYLSLLISMEIILTRFLSIKTPIVRIGFGFVPIALSGIMFGPWVTGLLAALCDILGMILFPSGAYFPGLTFSALIGGVIYGLFLRHKNPSIFPVILAVLFNTIFVDLFLNTIWVYMITNKAILALLPARIISNACMFPIKVFVVYTLWMILEKAMKKFTLVQKII